jgi:hypothetical protein
MFVERRFLGASHEHLPQPIFGRDGQIFAAPTFVKDLPMPVEIIIRDLYDSERIISGLDLWSDR